MDKDQLRFWSKVSLSPGCWEWAASRGSQGYGQIKVQGRVEGAHRLAYSYAYGPIPEGLHVLHSCDNPQCVRPTHLRVGTHLDNMRDKVARGRSRNHLAKR